MQPFHTESVTGRPTAMGRKLCTGGNRSAAPDFMRARTCVSVSKVSMLHAVLSCPVLPLGVATELGTLGIGCLKCSPLHPVCWALGLYPAKNFNLVPKSAVGQWF